MIGARFGHGESFDCGGSHGGWQNVAISVM